jgi:hypothetical protein
MIKFHELDAYKAAKNVGYCTCAAKLYNGMLVSANLVTKVAALPTSTTTKGDVWLVMNRIDKPEILKPNDYAIEIGEFPRIFNMRSLSGKMLEMDTDQVATAYASINVGDKLTANTAGKLAVTADVTEFDTYLEVVEKTTFGGTGLKVKVVDNTAAKAQAAAIAAAATAAAAAIAAAAELPEDLGTAGQVLTVNAGATGVEWKDVPEELPAALGTAGQVLKVNSGATGVEWGADATE